MSGTELDGEVLGEMDGGCFGGRVAEGGIVAEVAYADAGCGGSYDNAGG